MSLCPVCTSEVSSSGRFCPSCGAPLGADRSLTRTTPAEEHLPVRVVDGPAPMPAVRARFASEADGLAPGTVLAGRYRVVNIIGRGGMGEVYRADDLTLGQPVALKFLPRNLDQQSDRFGRFLTEVRSARQVSHPNVCRVYDIVQSEGRTFLAMEYVDGEDLSSLLRRIGRLPSNKATEIARQLCAGLAAAHDKGVLHRDLKPANVMLDGRGRARLTDFGLAGAEDVDLGFAGTPAYMAPEQLRGEPASARSEIYALGLVLYEVFTGRRLFDASSIEELRDLHDRTDITALSTGLTDVDPAVDRVIRRCLDLNPAKRPASALAVAAALPGGDPLAAALAAGETPAPALVAAAGGEGSLRPAVAIALLVAIVVLLGIVALLQPRVFYYSLIPTDPPDVMTGRAQDLFRRVGYADSPADSARGLYRDADASVWIGAQGPAYASSPTLASARPSPIVFWYRDSPATLKPARADAFLSFGALVMTDDPPMTMSGMRQAQFDARGRLLELAVVPPQVEPDGGGLVGASPDWAPLFAAAGLDVVKFARAAPQWLPPFAVDRRESWSGLAPERSDITLRVEAASYRGRPVWFSVIGPWSRPARQAAAPTTTGQRASDILAATIFLLLLTACAVLARRNLRLGRGDRRGAGRLAMYLFALGLLAWLAGTHVPALYELALFCLAAGQALFFAALLWLTYLALEPIVRRRLPDVIIDWSRALSGNLSDALVGRSVLVGVAAALLGDAYLRLCALVLPNPLAGQFLLLPLAGLTSLRGGVANTAVSQIASIYLSLAACLIYVASYAALRRHSLAGGVIFVIYGALSLLQNGFSPALLVPLVSVVLWLVVLARVGLLATTTFIYIGSVTMNDFPVTTDLTQWYGSTGLVGIVGILALATWAFRTSLGGQAVFKDA